MSASQVLPSLAHSGRVTNVRVALSEWTKLRSVRSTRWSLVTFLLALPSVFVSFWATQALLHAQPTLQTSLAAGGVARTLIGGAVYLVLIGVFAMALGAIIRNTAGGISIFAAIFFVIPP